MHPEMKAEMAQEYHQELDNMRAAANDGPDWPYELAALDAEGDELYRTEYQPSLEEARKEAARANDDLDRINASRDEPVHEFVPVATED